MLAQAVFYEMKMRISQKGAQDILKPLDACEYLGFQMSANEKDPLRPFHITSP